MYLHAICFTIVFLEEYWLILFAWQVLQQQTEAIARLGSVLKRDIRDMEIIMAEDAEMTDDAN